MIRKYFLIAVGFCSLALGILGIFLPLLPTTPFLLLSAYCFARSSDRAYQWLMNNRWFGEYIRNYQQGKGISLRHKAMTLSLLWLTIGYSAIFAVKLPGVKLLLLAIAIGVTVHLLKMKTMNAENSEL
ncbi:MAG: DUF454 domain-containing protein [Candidatus Wallbacteria bacterium HGW-Wallbacteria-1]|jgi:hypothetical protein|uniref:DUF454 domain-containing protein n=1 Tax=Candidatus Wallbacteria bacterium HGW-Wallbacteria-1 TaxID=2013854 RepID=A0A2N1PLW7_9BACT|nr:MAG: DUF454 domain-containing protein [Candidatus Wallbacteria bacterium HGW-Wallbacteria-1]